MDPEDGSASLCALTSVCEPAGLWNVPPGVADFVTSHSRFRGEEPPWPTSHHLVVVVGPQVGLLAGPCVREHADLEVGLAECVGSHQGDHLPAGHGKGVAEELDS